MKNHHYKILPALVLTVAMFAGCTKPQEAQSAASEAGSKLYRMHCATCHQGDGAGMPGAYPPLAGSEWVKGNPDILIAQVIQGMVGEIEVRGVKYRGAMPSVSHLKDEEVASIITFIRSQWGNKSGPVDAARVASVRKKLSTRTEGPWKSGEELKSAFP